MAKFFIKGAIKHKGSLHRLASKHNALNENGTINFAKLRPHIKTTHQEREYNLALELAHFHGRHKGTETIKRLKD